MSSYCGLQNTKVRKAAPSGERIYFTKYGITGVSLPDDVKRKHQRTFDSNLPGLREPSRGTVLPAVWRGDGAGTADGQELFSGAARRIPGARFKIGPDHSGV